MALSETDKEEIRDTIRAAMAKGCLCGHADDVPHFFERLKTLGDGNVEKGIESAFNTLQIMTRTRKLGGKIGSAVAVALAVSGASGLVALIWIAIETIIYRIKSGGP